MSEDALLLHDGRLAHVRHAPFRHRFDYRMWMISADVDRLDRGGSWVFAHNRWGVVSLRDRDHGARDGSALRPWVQAQLDVAGLGAFGAQIRFMAIPRLFGWAFSPIAFFFCRDATGRLGAVLHQVKNTFGDQHGYLLAVDPAVEPGAAIRQAADKQMHVSPFFDLRGGYRFAFRAPVFAEGGRFDIRISYGEADRPRLTATMDLETSRATGGRLLRLVAAAPLMPVKVFAAIHWQALVLWWRGARFHRAPVATPISTTRLENAP